VLELTESAIGVGQTIGIVGPCDVQVVSAVALGGLRSALRRMLEANSGNAEVRARNRSFTEPERMADELLDFFLRGVSPQDD
jgi:hypothetical protein